MTVSKLTTVVPSEISLASMDEAQIPPTQTEVAVPPASVSTTVSRLVEESGAMAARRRHVFFSNPSKTECLENIGVAKLMSNLMMHTPGHEGTTFDVKQARAVNHFFDYLLKTAKSH
jgi:hypothetical protein